MKREVRIIGLCRGVTRIQKTFRVLVGIAFGMSSINLAGWEIVKIEQLGYPDWVGPDEEMMWVRDISGDGAIIVGITYSGNEDYSFSWEDGLFTKLGWQEGDDVGEVEAISADGRIIVGSFNMSSDMAFRLENGESSYLGDVPGAREGTVAKAVSGDGSVIVGVNYTESGSGLKPQPFYWEDGNITGLPGAEMSPLWGWRMDVSYDGTLIVGTETYARRQAVYYDSGATAPEWISLPFPKGDGEISSNSEAQAVSADGFTIVGRIVVQYVHELPVVWQFSKDMTVAGSLLPIPSGYEYARATDVSGDGSVIVGVVHAEQNDHLVYWEKDTYYTPVVVLLSEITDNPELIRIDSALISDDGSTIAGSVMVEGFNPNHYKYGDGYSIGFRILLADFWGPHEVLPDGYCDTTPWMGWLNVENDPWIWSVDMDHWLYCPGDNVTESGAWVYIPK